MTTRYLLHSIDATTYTARRRQPTGRAGTFGILAFTLSVCGLLLWADRYFV